MLRRGAFGPEPTSQPLNVTPVRTRRSGLGVGLRRRAASLVLGIACMALAGSAASAATEIVWWHAMAGQLGRELENLAADFNSKQTEYRVVPVYKGNYTETVNAAIFAFRSRTQPAIVQVNEIATATMMAARGAIYPVYELMKDQSEPFDKANYLPAVTGYYTDLSGNMLSFPFNVSTPILYYNKDAFRKAGLDPAVPPKTWPEMEAAGKALRASGMPCGFTTHWPSWVNVESFSALHNIPLATAANGLGGLEAALVISNPLLQRHIEKLAEWQKTKLFDYSGRGTTAEPRFQRGDCGIFLGSSATRADILANSKFEVGYGQMPYWPDVKDAPQNTIIGGATLWVLRDRPADEYKGVAKFFTYLSQPEVQARWHQNTGYLPITKAAYDLTEQQGFYQRNPGADIAIKQMTVKPPTENSKGIRLGSFTLVRDAIEDELEMAFAGKKTAKEALDTAVERGNKLLRQFERTNR